MTAGGGGDLTAGGGGDLTAGGGAAAGTGVSPFFVSVTVAPGYWLVSQEGPLATPCANCCAAWASACEGQVTLVGAATPVASRERRRKEYSLTVPTVTCGLVPARGEGRWVGQKAEKVHGWQQGLVCRAPGPWTLGSAGQGTRARGRGRRRRLPLTPALLFAIAPCWARTAGVGLDEADVLLQLLAELGSAQVGQARGVSDGGGGRGGRLRGAQRGQGHGKLRTSEAARPAAAARCDQAAC